MTTTIRVSPPRWEAATALHAWNDGSTVQFVVVRRAVARPGPLTTVLGAVLLVAAYVGLAWLGSELGAVGSLTVWYPPAGLALAATVLLGWWAVPPLAAGELLAGAAVFDTGSFFTAPQLAANAIGYACVWGAFGWVIRRATTLDVRRLLGRVAMAFGLGAVAAPLAAALFGVGMQRWAGLSEESYPEAVGIWWTGDAVGVASITPSVLIAAWAVTRARGYRLFGRERPALLAAQLASPVVVAVVVFASRGEGVRFPYLVVIPIVLVALRLGIQGAGLSTLLLAPVMTFLVDTVDPAALDRTELQALLLVGIGTGLVVGAVVSERERLGGRHRELSDVIESTPDLVAIVGADGSLRYLNPAARAMAGIGADESLRGMRERELAPDSVAAELAAQARAAALRDGSWSGDVLVRTIDGDERAGSKVIIVNHGIDGQLPYTTSIIRDVTEQRRLERELARGALYDSLTGLPNRALLMERLDHALVRGRKVVFLVATVDRFAMITEGVGHVAGDEVIASVGARLAVELGPADTVARLGTDAFGILVDHDLDEVEATKLGDQLVVAVRGTLEVGDRTVPVTISVGIVSASRELRTAVDLVRCGEVAAHRAMDLGGCRTVRFSGPMSDRALRRLEIETELREALESDRWWLAYQPIIEVESGRMVSCEALLRWTGPDGAPVSPYEFILLAEETGLIVPLGEAVLQRACLESLGWSSHGERITVAVNVSARQLTEPGFVESVSEVLQRTGIEPHLVTVELTETSFAGDSALIRPLLDDLQALGVELAMDDFGTGYSSLAQLSGLPISKVKLDKSFIDDLATSERCRELVRGVITLSHALGLLVVAEGVETEAQLSVLRDLGCDRAQGYLFSRPVPPDDLLGLLRPLQRQLGHPS